MTKLMEWLLALSAIFAVWLSLVTKKLETDFTRDNNRLVLYSPVLFVLLFGLYAASVVMYRVFTFNNCEEAAVELKKEIEDARADLTKKGYVF